MDDEMPDRTERIQSERQKNTLRLDWESIAILRDRLRGANRKNSTFEQQYPQLMDLLQTILLRLNSHFGDTIEQVLAVGDWDREGIDLRNLPYDDLVIQIVLRSTDRLFSLYEEIAEKVFADLHDDDFLTQFRLETLPEWQHARSLTETDSREEALGIPLLVRA